MELNTWYYTLSTISQTLAAVLALAAVFVVVRLESLNKNINDYRGRALKIIILKERYVDPGNKRNWDNVGAILADLREFKNNYSEKYRKIERLPAALVDLSNRYDVFSKFSETEFIKNTLENLDSFVSQRDGLMKLLKWPGIVVSLAISASIVLLSFSDKVYNQCILFLTVALALFGLFSVMRAAWKILDAIKRIE